MVDLLEAVAFLYGAWGMMNALILRMEKACVREPRT
jgi:hypothetical protein